MSNTNLPYSRVNIYSAVREVKQGSDEFNLAANNSAEPTVDCNGTIAGAYIVPNLSLALEPLQETIGREGDRIYDNDVDF